MTTTAGRETGPQGPGRTSWQPSGRLPAYRPPEGQRGREIVRGLLSLLAVLVIVVGVPVGLLLALGSPFPSAVPDRDTLTAELDPMAVLRILSLVVWLAWAHFVVCLVVEWRSERRGVGLPTPVWLGGGSQGVARRLVASILLLTGTAVLAAPVLAGPHGGPAPGQPVASAAREAGPADVVPQARQAANDAAQARQQAAATRHGAKVFYDVAPPTGRHHDSLWDIAERYLGDGRRYKEIFALNEGREQPDGRTLEQARLIRPGWVLQLPGDASGPGLRIETPPALTPSGAGGSADASRGSAADAGSGDGVTADAATADGADLPWRGAVGASLVAAGLLASLRRARGTAPVEPDASGTEEALRLAADEVGARFLDHALRGLVVACGQENLAVPEVYAACLGTDELILSLSPARSDAPAPWRVADDGRSWSITRAAAEEVLVGDDVLAPFPGLACFGAEGAWRMLLDLESAPGIVSLGGDPATARALAASVAVELATNRWSDRVHVTLVGFGDELDGLAAGRLRHARWLDDVLHDVEERMVRQARALADDTVLRGRGARPDRALWAPEFIVLSAPPAGDELTALMALTGDVRRTVGVLCVGDVPGARWRFVVSRNGTVDTGVLGLTLQAQLLRTEHYRQLTPLFAHAAEAAGERAALERGDVVALPLRAAGDAGGSGPTPAAPAPAVRPVPERHLDVDARMPVEVRLLGPVEVQAPGPVDAARAALVTELVALLAVHRSGVHPNVVSSALWPRGVEDAVRDATLAHAQGWLGRDSAGRPRLRQSGDGRWVLDDDVRCDWSALQALAGRAADVEASDPMAADRLRARALSLVGGPALEDLPPGRYSWLARTGVERDLRRTVVATAHTLATARLQRGDLAGAAVAARDGLRLLPEAEVLWRDLLGAVARDGDPDALRACAEELYATLEQRRVAKPESPTDALVEELLPGFRRPAA